MITHKPHCASYLGASHAFRRQERRLAVRAKKIDLRLTVAEHMDVGGFVVIDENDNAKSMRAVDRDHAAT